MSALPESWATFLDVKRGDKVSFNPPGGGHQIYEVVGKDGARIALRPTAAWREGRMRRGGLDEIWTREAFEGARFLLLAIEGAP